MTNTHDLLNHHDLQADDVIIINRKINMPVCAMSCLVQKLLNSYTPLYHGGAVKAAPRNSSQVVPLQDALISIFWRHVVNNSADNENLEINLDAQWRPRIKVGDLYYLAALG